MPPKSSRNSSSTSSSTTSSVKSASNASPNTSSALNNSSRDTPKIPLNDDDMDNYATEAESASENETAKPLPLPSIRKREQYSKFSSWLKMKAEEVVKEESKEQVQTGNDEILSIRSLMARQESSVLINDPREYQIELFEKAKKQNIVAVLDTGSGKTLIAVLLLKHVLDAELENRQKGKKPRIAFFLVDCVTLVFQQFAVLESNLGHRIERFCGEMGCDLWSKTIWKKHFEENMVLVCTAEILYQCLMHSFISIDQINLLIFDEAHHAKKNHAYARIIKDFYIAEVDPQRRPKIFGMTASPVDANEDVVQAAKELEAMLDCQISTTSDLSLVAKAISRPKEIIVPYNKPRPPYSTPLGLALKERFGQLDILSKLFEYSKESASYLGEWCADRIWFMVFLEKDEILKLERLVEGAKNSQSQIRSIEQRDAELALLREARSFIAGLTFPPMPADNGLSSKVVELISALTRIFDTEKNTKCIVFVKRRYTARLLADLLTQLGPSSLRVGLLIGTRYGDPGDVKFSFRQQILTLNRFRKGEVNCLLATSIAEEGLDIPDCNVVIRFDLYDTMIQYIQSRGRARHANSTYLHMLESGNMSQHRAITEVRQGERKMRQFCAALPEDRILQGNDYDFDKALAKELSMMRKYTEPSTGAKLTYTSSLVVLSHFLGCLPMQDGALRQATFVMNFQSKQYVCEVQLPENSPLRFAIGRPASRKSIAKRSAAFEACLLLRRDGHLDANLIPTYHKRLPSMRNAQLALNMKQSNSYKMRIKPVLWEQTLGSEPEEVFMTVLELEAPELLGRPCQPLALLTRTLLPDFPKFQLYLQVGQTSQLICTAITKSMKLVAPDLADLNGFTLRIYRDVFNKKFEDNIAKMSYWLAPILLRRRIFKGEQFPESLVDWSVVKEVNAQEQLEWNPYKPHSFLSNRYFIDRWSGGRRFFSVEVVPGLRADQPIPGNETQNAQTVLEFTSKSLFKKSKARATWILDQPVILAHSIPIRLNWLDDWTEKERAETTIIYICPEPLQLSVVPVSVVSMAYLFPAILTRLEAYLISLEVCDLLGLRMHLGLTLEALTKDSDNTDEHRLKQIHVRRGMGKNYERLEFIGDSFLKMATSISLFSQNPEDNEYDYHVKRMLLICNKNLFRTALDKKIYEYIRSVGFSRRNWYPQYLILLQGKGHNKAKVEAHNHQLGDKTVADVCEALIGAALLSYKDTGNMDMAVKAVTALVSDKDHDVSEWSQYYRLYTKPRYQLAQASAAQLDLAAKIEDKHDYHFRYPRLLQSAFTHPSLPFSWSDKIPCYQRLEFLGDALLDMACINFLFHRHPNEDPQWLTEHKMAMVSNRFLAALAARLGFHRHIRVGGAVVEAQNRDYVAEVKEAETQSNGSPDYWTATKYAPKALSDVVEAYIGAIFVDSEYNYKEVERFFEAHIRWFFEDIRIYDTFANNHPTTLLHNRLNLEYKCKLYRLMANELPANPYTTSAQGAMIAAVMIHGEVIADATASSSKNAKVRASERALQLIAGLSVTDFRKRFGCDCKGGETEEDELVEGDGRLGGAYDCTEG